MADLPSPSPKPGPAPTLDSSCSLVCIPSKGRYYLLTKSSLRRHVQIIKIDPVSGALKFTQTYGRDMFPTEAQALEFLKHEGHLEVLGTGKHVLGYIVIGYTGLLLVVEKARIAATLPGNHQVKTVVTSKWYKIPLQSPQLVSTPGGQPQTDPEALMSPAQRDEYSRGVDKITTFPIDGAHYFCETIDLTRPFPSYRAATQPSWEFVWNKWLMTAFRSVGLDFLCPALLQGLCEERQLNDFDGAAYSIALISRKGRLHVGPRYKARGLNDYAEPANEIEVEQVIWRRPTNESQPISWSRYTWRRGSVPLWWGVHMKNNGLGEAEIKIKESRTFKGSRRYIRRLQKRYCPVPQLDPPTDDTSTNPTAAAGVAAPAPGSTASAVSDAPAVSPRSTGASSSGSVTSSLAAAVAQDPSLAVPLVFVSLLRKGTPDRDRSEAKLAAAYDFMSNTIRKEHRIPLQFIALDWHELDKQLGSHELVSAFWSTVKDMLPQHGFALGTMTKVGSDHTDLARQGLEPPPNEQVGFHPSPCTSYAGMGWRARWFRQQRGITRYNCADSLDRTNVGSFFGAIQVFVEQCRELDIAVAVAPRGVGSIVNVIKRQQNAAGSFSGAAGGGAPNLSRPSSGPAQRSLATTSQRGTLSGSAGSSAGITQGFDKLGKLFTDNFRGSKGNLADQPQDSASLATRSVHGTPLPPHTPGGRQSPQPARAASPALSPGGISAVALDEITRSLPQGWEVKIDNASERLFYVDHNSRTTHWHHPTLSQEAVEEIMKQAAAAQAEWNGAWGQGSPNNHGVTPLRNMGGLSRTTLDHPDLAGAADRLRLAEEEREQCEPLSPWCMLKSSARQFQRRISPSALSAMAELFLVNGDMSAWLYTGSQAMHSERILLFEPENSKLRKAGVGAYGNIMVGIKRRYNNVMMDTERQTQLELFLGMKHSVYFPMTKLYYKEEGPVPLDAPETDDDTDPVGHIDWAPAASGDRGAGSGGVGTSGAGTSASGTDLAHMGPGHSRHRNKSYSSVDLLWDKVNAAGGLRAGIIKNALGHNAHHAHHAPAGSAPSLAGAAAGGGALLDSRTGSMSTVVSISAGGIPTNASGNLDEAGIHMHKAVSDPAMISLTDGEPGSDASSQASESLAALPLERLSASQRSASFDILPHSGSSGTGSPSAAAAGRRNGAASGGGPGQSRFSMSGLGGGGGGDPRAQSPQLPEHPLQPQSQPQRPHAATPQPPHTPSTHTHDPYHHSVSADALTTTHTHGHTNHNDYNGSGESMSVGVSGFASRGGTSTSEQLKAQTKMVGAAISKGFSKFTGML